MHFKNYIISQGRVDPFYTSVSSGEISVQQTLAVAEMLPHVYALKCQYFVGKDLNRTSGILSATIKAWGQMITKENKESLCATFALLNIFLRNGRASLKCAELIRVLK